MNESGTAAPKPGMKTLVAVPLILSLLVVTSGTAAPAAAAATPTLGQLVGQKFVVRMTGTTLSTDYLGRIRRGAVGGVILFGSNVTTRSALIALTGKLRAAAAAGGRPHLLIAVDQEGGAILRSSPRTAGCSPSRPACKVRTPRPVSSGDDATTDPG